MRSSNYLILTIFTLNVALGRSQPKPEIILQSGHLSGVTAIAFSPDSKYLASASEDRTIKIWAIAIGNLLYNLEWQGGSILSLAFSSDNQNLIAVDQNYNITIWKKELDRWITSRQWNLPLAKNQQTPLLVFACLSPNGVYFATKTKGGLFTLRKFDILNKKYKLTVISEINEPACFRSSFAFSSDSRYFASTSNDYIVNIWDPQSGTLIKSLGRSPKLVSSLAFDPSGKYIFVGYEDSKIRIWSIKQGKVLDSIKVKNGKISCLLFDQNRKYLALSTSSNRLEFFDSQTLINNSSIHRRILSDDVNVTSMAFSPDGQHLATVSNINGAIKIWKLSIAKLTMRLKSHAWPVYTLSFSPDGRFLASGHWDNNIRLWNIKTGTKLPFIIKGHAGTIKVIAFSPDGRYLASASADGTIKFWEVNKALALYTTKDNYGTDSLKVLNACLTLQEDFGITNAIAFSPNGKFFAAAGINTINIWQVEMKKNKKSSESLDTCIILSSRKILHTRKKFAIYTLAFSNNGEYLAAGGGDSNVKDINVWKIDTKIAAWEHVNTLEGHLADVSTLAFLSNENLLISGSLDKTIKIWDTKGDVIKSFDQSTLIYSFAMDRNGKYMAIGGQDKTLRLYAFKAPLSQNLKGRSSAIQMPLPRELKGHNSTINSIIFSPESRYLVSGGEDGQIIVWDVKSGGRLVTMVAFDKNDWVAYTYNGYYNASKEGGTFIAWKLNDEIYLFNQYENKFLNPSYIKQVLTDNIEINMKPSNLPIPPHVKIVNPSGDTTISETKIKFRMIANDDQGIEEIKIINNLDTTDVEVKTRAPYSHSTNIALKDSVNHLKVLVIDNEGTKSAVSRTITVDNHENGMAKGLSDDDRIKNPIDFLRSLFSPANNWVILIAVQDYPKESGYSSLKYTLNDADKLKEILITKFGYPPTQIKEFKNEQAIKTIIERYLSQDLQAKLSSKDRVLIYFTGHGDRQKLHNEEWDYYLIPFDGRKNNLIGTCISKGWLQSLLLQLHAKHSLAIIDACYGGLENPKGSAEETIKTFASEPGQHMLGSGRFYQQAYEKPEVKMSRYTYFLSKALEGEADISKDGVITLYELQQYMEEKVTEDSNREQQPDWQCLNKKQKGQYLFYK